MKDSLPSVYRPRDCNYVFVSSLPLEYMRAPRLSIVKLFGFINYIWAGLDWTKLSSSLSRFLEALHFLPVSEFVERDPLKTAL